jgi:hypothetical protein
MHNTINYSYSPSRENAQLYIKSLPDFQGLYQNTKITFVLVVDVIGKLLVAVLLVVVVVVVVVVAVIVIMVAVAVDCGSLTVQARGAYSLMC